MSIIINNWRMDPSLNALIHCETGETRRLGEYHFILLETLAKNADVVLSRSYLCAEVWKNRIVGGNSLPTAIHALRVAIDDDGKQQNIIKTIPKKGYLCNKEYVSLPESSPAEALIITDQIQGLIRRDSVASGTERRSLIYASATTASQSSPQSQSRAAAPGCYTTHRHKTPASCAPNRC